MSQLDADIRTKTLVAEARPEVELLLCCAQTGINSSTAERIQTLLQGEIDWADLLQVALFQHQVMPLLYNSLNTICPEVVPQPVLAQLRTCFHDNARRNLFLTAELLKLLDLLEANEIPAIPYRGAVLAASIYGNIALRQFSDLDLLVHQRDFLKTKELLISHQYQLIQELSWEHHFVSEHRVNVDLHQAIAHSNYFPALDFDRLWQRLQPFSLAGKTIPNLRSEDLLLILCMQLFKDFWEWQGREKLAQVCDIAELVQLHPELDWQGVMAEAEQLGIQRLLFIGLLLSKQLLATDLPEQVLQRIQSDVVAQALCVQVSNRLLSKIKKPPRLLESSIFYLRAKERLQDKVQFCITPSEYDRKLLPLPSFFSFLYYPLRPLRVVGKLGLGQFKRFFLNSPS